MKSRYKFLILIFTGLVLVYFSLMSGSLFISPSDLKENITTGNHLLLDLIIKLRLPRTIMAITIGSALGVSGVIIQALLKNELAEPYTTGIASGSALGVAACTIIGISSFFIPLFAIAGGILTSLFVFWLAVKKNFNRVQIILGGVAISFILSSAIMLLFALAKAEMVHKTIIWLMGDLGMANYHNIIFFFIIVLIIMIISFFYHNHLDLLLFGHDVAHTSGVTRTDYVILFWLAVILASLSVALAGVIGFIGLIIPHICRIIFGSRHFLLIPASALTGASFLLLCDTIARTVALPYELPVGIITSLCGGIFFITLIVRKGDSL